MRHMKITGAFLLAITLTALSSLASSSVTSGYQIPPKELAAMVDAPLPPATRLSPDRSKFLYMERPGLRTIAEVSREELRLAGVRFYPDDFTTTRSTAYANITVHEVGGKSFSVTLPEGRIMY